MAYTTEGIRNIALVGHSAAGKTTLFEALLHAGGVIGAPGSVERGTTVSDYDPMEKERKQSLNTVIASIDHGDCHLKSALLTIRECGLGQFQRYCGSQGFIGNKRVLCATRR